MIRVLHMIPFGAGSQGGIEHLIMNVYRNINKEKIQFDFMTYGNPSAFEKEITELGGTVYKLPSRRSNAVKAYYETKKLIEMHRKDYKWIHMHLCTASNILPLRFLKSFTEPQIIIHSHLSGTLSNPISTFMHYLNRGKLLMKADYLFSCSDLAAEHLFGIRYNQDKRYYFIPNAINIECFRYNDKIRKKMRDLYGFESEIVLGYIGRLSPPKNVDKLIDIIKGLSNKTIKLVIIGSGDCYEKINNKISDYGLSNRILLLGEQTEIPNFLQMIDIFVSASVLEGFPVTLVEAQACGLPCIITDSISKQVNLNNNVVFTDSHINIQQWEQAINKVTKTGQTRDCIKLNPQFDIKHLAEFLEDFYEKK